MPEKRVNIDKSLRKKGFRKTNQGRHFYYILIVDGKLTNIRTKMSMGSQHATIGDNLLSKMSKQLKMRNPGDFKHYIECTYSESNYIHYLKSEGCV